MGTLFIKVLNMSLTASYCILFVFLARFCFRKMPKLYSYLLWLIVAFRLICPFSFESAFSFLRPEIPGIHTASALQPEQFFMNQVPFKGDTVNLEEEKLPILSPSRQTSGSQTAGFPIVTAGGLIWISVIAILLSFHLRSYIRLRRKLVRSADTVKTETCGHIKVRVREAEGLETPFVFGFIKPEIYLPKGLSGQERKYCLAHELIHISRKDHLIKPAALMLACVYWFNPLVWLAFFYMTRDMEMACDEAVIQSLDIKNKKQYSSTLLALACSGHFTMSGPLAFGEHNVNRRIKNIMNYKKPAIWISAVCVLAILSLAAGLLANPKETTETVENQSLLTGNSNQSEAEASTVVDDEEDSWYYLPVSLDRDAPAGPSFAAFVNVDTLNLRKLPSNDSEIVGMLPKAGEIKGLDLVGAVREDEHEQQLVIDSFGIGAQKYAAVHFETKDGKEVQGYVDAKYLDLAAEPENSYETLAYWASKIWAEAFCARDGQMLKQMMTDKSQAKNLPMAEVLENGKLTFGLSSPWPWGSYAISINENAGVKTSSAYDVTLYFYAETSDPSVAVWVQQLLFDDSIRDEKRLDKFADGVIAQFSEITYYDEISTAAAFDEAYIINGSLQLYDYDQSGFAEGIVNQLKNGQKENAAAYGKPDTAAEKCLHLTGGSAKTVKQDENTALVRYTFSDGSKKDIPMHLYSKNPAVWTVGEGASKENK